MPELSKGKKLLIAVVLIAAVVGLGVLAYFTIKYMSKPDEPEFVVPLTGTPLRVPPGGTFTLSWKVENATKVTFQNNQIDVTGISTLPFPVGALTGPVQFVVTAVKDLPTGGQTTVNSSWTGYVDAATTPNIFFDSFFPSNNYYGSYSDFVNYPQSLVLQWTTNTDVNIESAELVQTIEADYSGTPDIPKVLYLPLNVALDLPNGKYTISPATIPNIPGIFFVLYNLRITNTDQQTIQSGNIIVQFGGPPPPPSVSLQTIPPSGTIVKGTNVQLIWYISNVATNQSISLALIPLKSGTSNVTWTNIYPNDSTTVSTNNGSVRVIFRIETLKPDGTIGGTSFFNYIIQVSSFGVNTINLFQTTSTAGYDPDPKTNYTGFCAQPANNYQAPVAHSGGTQYGIGVSTGDFLATYYAHQHVSLFPCLEYSLGIDVGITDLAVTAGPSPASTDPLWPICPPGTDQLYCRSFIDPAPIAPSPDVCYGNGKYCNSLHTNVVANPDVGCPVLMDAVTNKNIWDNAPVSYRDALNSKSENNLMRYILVESSEPPSTNQNNWDDYYNGTAKLNNSFIYNTSSPPTDEIVNTSVVPGFLNTKLCVERNPSSSSGKLSWVMLATLPAVSASTAQPLDDSNQEDSGWNATSLLPISTSNPPGQSSNAYPLVFQPTLNKITSMLTSVVMASSNVSSNWTGSNNGNGGGILGNFIFTSSQEQNPSFAAK